MSLAIDINRVTHVLLQDGWHEVSMSSFDLDAYEFLWSGLEDTLVSDMHKDEHLRNRDPIIVHGGGNGGICSTGFSFIDLDTLSYIAGPLTSILAVKYASR